MMMGGPPTTKEEYLKTPMPNPQMQEAMRTMQPQDVFMFWISQPDMVEDGDLN